MSSFLKTLGTLLGIALVAGIIISIVLWKSILEWIRGTLLPWVQDNNELNFLAPYLIDAYRTLEDATPSLVNAALRCWNFVKGTLVSQEVTFQFDGSNYTKQLEISYIDKQSQTKSVRFTKAVVKRTDLNDDIVKAINDNGSFVIDVVADRDKEFLKYQQSH
jgi:hypothetical protein